MLLEHDHTIRAGAMQGIAVFQDGAFGGWKESGDEVDTVSYTHLVVAKSVQGGQQAGAGDLVQRQRGSRFRGGNRIDGAADEGFDEVLLGSVHQFDRGG